MRVEAIACWLSAAFLALILSFCAGYEEGLQLALFLVIAIGLISLFVYRGFYFWKKTRGWEPRPKLSEIDYRDIGFGILKYEIGPLFFLLLVAIAIDFYMTYKKGSPSFWKDVLSSDFMVCLGIFVGYYLLLQAIAILWMRRRFHTTLGKMYCWCNRTHDSRDGFFSVLYLLGIFIMAIYYSSVTGK